MQRRSAVLVLVLVSPAVSLAAIGAKRWAGPAAIVFELAPGDRVMLANFDENMRFFQTLEPGTVLRSDTAGRHGIDVAMFYVRSRAVYDRPLNEISFANADMRATYYPGRGTRPAILVSRPTLSGFWRVNPVVSRQGIEVLRSYGVPTRDTIEARR